MIEVGTKVHVQMTQTSRDTWKDNVGTVIQVMEANNSFTNKPTMVHIVRLDNGQEAPVEEKFLTAI